MQGQHTTKRTREPAQRPNARLIAAFTVPFALALAALFILQKYSYRELLISYRERRAEQQEKAKEYRALSSSLESLTSTARVMAIGRSALHLERVKEENMLYLKIEEKSAIIDESSPSARELARAYEHERSDSASRPPQRTDG